MELVERMNVNTAIVGTSEIGRALLSADTPKKSKAVETMAATAKAYAKEQGDYKNYVDASYIYILARRNTTELIVPEIQHGGNGTNQYMSKGNNNVTLADFGFTKMQWNRRTNELKIALDEIDAYFDECIAKGWEPSVYGLVRYTSNPDNPHVSFNSGENEWYTPPEYIEAARRVMGSIDTDPASSELANETVKAETYYTEEEDGLVNPWTGNVWMNPPYSQPLISQFADAFAEKYNADEFTQACVLVNNATETNWYQSLLTYASAVCFLKGRVKFIDKTGNPSGAPLQGQTVLYFGDNEKQFADVFSKFGIILYGRSC